MTLVVARPVDEVVTCRLRSSCCGLGLLRGWSEPRVDWFFYFCWTALVEPVHIDTARM